MLQQTNANWLKFTIGIVLSTILSLSVHTVMLQKMNVPFPDLSVITMPYKFVIRIFSVFGLLFFWHLADKKVNGSFVKKWAILFLIDAMLTESLFRGPFMDGYCTNSLGFMLINNIPKLFTIAIICGLVVFTAPKLNNVLYKFLAAIALAAVFMFAINPLSAAAWKPVMEKISYLAPTGEWCKLPYGPDVLIPAYISFIEPVLACMEMAMLILNQLTPVKWLRLLLFALLVVTINYQLLMPFFYVLKHKGPFISNLASEGQFALESIVLAITTGLTWQWSSLVKSTAGEKTKKVKIAC
ncbi:hypothetical protein IM793_16540 [Pedobacter sp. MR2016-19]|uniref:hypothetical protein n=1 Tax=Pedobacter sp. MR2016-19 TaxID=2780089 RepID=UPI001875B863|nr:hypothetical protein [Pedobacter sp. MR2016-19]MBE5320779.1 hypothetical protein [Pedobacter sp. MR2016-19]